MKAKYCKSCDSTLPLSAFNKSNRRDGYQTYCRECHNAMQRAAYSPGQAAKRRMRAERRKMQKPDASREKELKRLYGISVEEYNSMLEGQKFVCMICSEPCKTRKSLCVDHDHATGIVRGLLCNRCNRAIGMFKDDPELLRRAADYLS